MLFSHYIFRVLRILLATGCIAAALPISAQTLNFTISTDSKWIDTGLDLKPGEAVGIAAKSAGTGQCSPAGVPGAAANSLPNPNVAPGALVARIQENGTAWLVGASREFHITSPGHLWLGINVDGPPPCQGAFAVAVVAAEVSDAAAKSAVGGAPAGSQAAVTSSGQKNGTGSTTTSSQTPNDQVSDVKGALETAAQTWLSGQFGMGKTGTSSSATESGSGGNGVPALSIPADKISKAPLDTQLKKNIDGLPRRVNDQFKNLGDMVNFVIVGSQVKVADALTAADWHIADRDVKESVLKAALETYQKKAYLTMPMSDLYLYGRIQDYGYEQAEPYAVVASRHHFRIWKAPFTFNGQEVWAGAGTHDIGFEKDQRNGNVTHKIDPNVDSERDNIGATLEKSGKVKSLTYYMPPNPVQDSRNATGGGYRSDGRLLVIQLN